MSERYTVIVPASWEQDLKQAVIEVEHSGAHGEAGIQVTDGSIENATAQLEFDPFTIGVALYVADIVVKAAVGLAVTELLKALFRKRESQAAAVAERILVLTPTGEVMTIDVGTPESIITAIKAILAEAKALEETR